MNKSAIEQLTKLATIGLSEELLSDNRVVAVPDGFKLISLEEFDHAPDHFRANFDTSILDEFIKYILAHSHGEDTSIFINQNNMSANAIIDMGSNNNPLWGKNRAQLKLTPTSAYSDLLKWNGEPLTQQRIIDFFEDWNDCISFYFDDASLASAEPFAKYIKNIRNIKVNAQKTAEQTKGNYSSSMSALETIEIKSGADELPAGFLFNMVPYEGFNSIVLNCQLRAITDEKSVKLKYRIGQFDFITEQLSNELRGKVVAKLNGESIKLFIGEITYQ